MKLLLLHAALVLLVSGCSRPPTDSARHPAEQAERGLVGRITYGGALVDETLPGVSRVPNCKAPRPAGALRVDDDGGLANVLVLLRPAGGDRAPLTAPTTATAPDFEIRARGCRFHPRVSVVPQGTRLTLFNDDAAAHGAHLRRAARGSEAQASSTRRNVQNIMLPPGEQPTWLKLDQPGLIEVRNDLLPTMRGWLYVRGEKEVAVVTDAEGRFTLPTLPPGTYEVELLHEVLGRVTPPTVTVPPDGPGSLYLELPDPP